MGKEKKATKNFNKAKAKQQAKQGTSSKGKSKPLKPMKSSSGLTKKRIPKNELLEAGESAGEQVIKIKRPKKEDQDASVAR